MPFSSWTLAGCHFLWGDRGLGVGGWGFWGGGGGGGLVGLFQPLCVVPDPGPVEIFFFYTNPPTMAGVAFPHSLFQHFTRCVCGAGVTPYFYLRVPAIRPPLGPYL